MLYITPLENKRCGTGYQRIYKIGEHIHALQGDKFLIYCNGKEKTFLGKCIDDTDNITLIDPHDFNIIRDIFNNCAGEWLYYLLMKTIIDANKISPNAGGVLWVGRKGGMCGDIFYDEANYYVLVNPQQNLFLDDNGILCTLRVTDLYSMTWLSCTIIAELLLSLAPDDVYEIFEKEGVSDYYKGFSMGMQSAFVTVWNNLLNKFKHCDEIRQEAKRLVPEYIAMNNP